MTKTKPGALRLDAPICDLDGAQLIDVVAGAGGAVRQVPVTLARIAANALMQVYAEEANLDGVEKVRRFALAMKLQGGDGRLEPAELELLRERITRGYGPLVVGRALELLDSFSPAPTRGPAA